MAYSIRDIGRKMREKAKEKRTTTGKKYCKAADGTSQRFESRHEFHFYESLMICASLSLIRFFAFVLLDDLHFLHSDRLLPMGRPHSVDSAKEAKPTFL